MPRISKRLDLIKRKFEDVRGTFSHLGMFTDDKEKTVTFLALFDNVEDARIKGMCTYSTRTVVGIAFLAVLNEAETWVDIAEFAEERKEFLKEFFDDIQDTLPSHDTYNRVFSLISTETLEDTLVEFLQDCVDSICMELSIDDSADIRQLAIDGKEERGSGRKYDTPEKIRNQQIMHFWDTSNGINIKSVLIDSKTNEIPTAQKVLSTLNIRGMIISSDAMNTQKETVSVIRNGRAHYILGLKGNHGDLHSEAAQLFAEKKKFSSKNRYTMEPEKNHNQVETREFYRLDAKEFVFADEWKDIKSIVAYKKTTFNVITNQNNTEVRFYISDLSDLQLISCGIRNHWSVENQLHWHLDMNYHQDDNTTMNGNALTNLSVLKKTALTIMKLLKPLFGSSSIRGTKKRFGYHFEENVIKLFAILDGSEIKTIIEESK